MRDPERIARIAKLLSDVWELVPDWRLTQLVINASDTKQDCGSVFYLEDDEFESRLRRLHSGLQKPSTQNENTSTDLRE